MNAVQPLQCGRTVFLYAMAGAVRPRRALTVSQWADAHRVLTSKASSEDGPWKTARTPYLREIMDSLSSRSPVRRVVLMTCTQIGKTEVGLNWIGYVMDHNPGPMLVVVPTLEVRKRWHAQRLAPMMKACENLRAIFGTDRKRDAANSEEMKDFPGGMVVLGGANSPASLASMPIRDVLMDEVDRFPWEVGQEGDPIGLIDERTKTFPRRKVLLVSTPTIKDASRIEDEYEHSDQRRYQVPCPHCDELLVLQWGNLQWDKALTRAVYVCEHCGSEIKEHHKTTMLARGRWIAKHPERTTRGYHINGLYAPLGLGFRWLELAQKFVETKRLNDKGKLKRFINTTLGETWEDRTARVETKDLVERAEPYALRQIPPGCLLLTAGVDTQDDRLAVQILGWGRNEENWVIDYVEIPGDPSRDDLWDTLAAHLNAPLVNAYGRELRIQATAIDTGGHYTHDVYHFVRRRTIRRPMAIKGANTPSKPILPGRPTPQDINRRGKVIKNGVQLWTVGTDTAKHLLLRRLVGDGEVAAGERRIHFSEGLEEEYYNGLLCEKFDPEKNRWVKRRGRRNEPLDTWVYGRAAAHHPEIRVHAMRKQDWERLTAALEPEMEQEQQKREKETPKELHPVIKTRHEKSLEEMNKRHKRKYRK